MSEASADPPPVAIWQHALSVLLFFGFMGLGWLRLNDCDLFNPDSPRYVIYAQSLVEHGSYRAIDTPGEALYTWRPPGLPLLLAPALWLRPYDVVAAKLIVLITAGLLLVVVHRFASSLAGGWSGPIAVALVASSPIFLVLSTEVLSEVPYTLGTMAVLYWLGRSSEQPDQVTWLCWLAVLAVLAYLPTIRTVGVSLVVATGVWILCSRRRWQFAPAAVAAIAGLVWLARRGGASSGDNYAGSLMKTWHERGIVGVISDAWQTVLYYVSAWSSVLFPGAGGERPFYALMIPDALPSLPAQPIFVNGMTALVLLLALLGLWHKKAAAGGVSLLYVILYGGCLAVWPWRHERFLWPLVPIVWVFVPVGMKVLLSSGSLRSRAMLQSVTGLAVLSLCGWQVQTDWKLIAANQRFLSQGDQFYSNEFPSFYYSDWRKAGNWLREHSPEHARLLVWHAAVGGTAHRYQRRAQFEAMLPERIRQQVAAFSARYLVVPTAQFGDGFGWAQLSADPACKLKIVYRERDVTILEVEPNRTGEVSRSAHEEWLTEQLAKLDVFVMKRPERHDVLIRRAGLLRELGRNREAIEVLRGLVDRGLVTARVCADLGWAHFEEGQYEDAAKYLELASGLPNAESAAATLINGARRAHERSRESESQAAAKQVDRALSRMQARVASLRWAAAEVEIEQLMTLAPERADVQYWRGYLHHVAGEFDQAQTHYERAVALGSKEAQSKLLLMRIATVVSEGKAVNLVSGELSELVDPQAPTTHVRLAKLYDEHGWSGRAVAVLEDARVRFGDQPEVLSPLAELYRMFARPEEAAPLYRLVLEQWPYDKAARQGLTAAESELRTPRF